MNQAAKTLLTIASFAISLTAFAHGDAGEPKHGGITVKAKDMEYELVPKADSIALYVEDHGKKIDSKGAQAKVTLLSGGKKTEVNLIPAGDNKLEAKGAFQVGAGTKAVTTVTLAGKSAATVRFVVK